MSKIALMCGHGKSTDGSWDCGTAYGGNNEAALMLPITKAAVKYLRASGVTVISDADTNNNKNMIADVSWANKEGVSIYVSLHCDWYKAPTGTLPLYVSAKGKTLATTINNAVMSGMGMKTRGVTKRTDLYELNYTDAPACIFETGSIKADISKLKDSDKYGKCIAKGICNYLGVAFKESETPTPAPVPQPTPEEHLYRVRKSWTDSKSQIGAYKVLENAKKACDANKGYSVFDEKGKKVYPIDPPKTVTYRVRKTWNDAKSQVGAYKVLENAKKMCDKHAGYSVFDENGKAVYTSKAAPSLIDNELEACKTQADWMKNSTYAWESNPTVPKSKKKGTCVTYVACVLQRIGILPSGSYIWHDEGKVYGNNSKMTVTYPGDKKLHQVKSQLKAGDIIMDGDKHDNGSGSHIFILTGQWSGDNPIVWDNHSAQDKGGKSYIYTRNRPVIAIVRLK